MSTTKGELAPAKIYAATKEGSPLGTVSVDCHFNPHEYTVTKANSYSEEPKNKSDVPLAEFKKAGAQKLKLSLLFDTYEEEKDVSEVTSDLWKLMEVKTRKEGDETKKIPPPHVAFEWKGFKFVSVITNMTQKFTLFNMNGTPVRAKVDITFLQDQDPGKHGNQNPTSGGGPIEQVHKVIGADRLDVIAAQVYGDATKWRMIAERNGITNPLNLTQGALLAIPPEN